MIDRVRGIYVGAPLYRGDDFLFDGMTGWVSHFPKVCPNRFLFEADGHPPCFWEVPKEDVFTPGWSELTVEVDW